MNRRLGRSRRMISQPTRLSPGLNALLEAVRQTAPREVFNQYGSANPALDLPSAGERRLANLARYLELFAGVRYLLVGEAAGYGACRLTGVPFTDEEQLLGPNPLSWAGPAQGFQRCTRIERPLSREASARVVWKTLGRRRDVALWNVVPWHPEGLRGALSNRPPGRAARTAGLGVLSLALETAWPAAQVVAVGRVAEAALRRLGQPGVSYVRHPARGGSGAFRAGMAQCCQPGD